MRIKSYFAPSVQSAISIARKEFGDEVTLVTSHAASLESRHLGDYEVVFAVDEVADAEPSKPAQVIKAAAPAAKAATPEAKEPAREVKAAGVAVMEPEPEAAVERAPAPFQSIFEEAIAVPLSTEEDVPEKLDRVRSMLVEMGIDAAMLRALMTMIERSVAFPVVTADSSDAVIDVAAEPAAQVEAEAVAEAEPAVPVAPDLTPAELAFYLSVSVGSCLRFNGQNGMSSARTSGRGSFSSTCRKYI
jgi:flagellar biosynthesis GTPase FlhF